MGTPLRERTKVIVRRLPPSLSEADFKVAIDADFEGQYTWFTYVPGKVSLKSVKHSIAYLNFADALRVYDFRSKFDGHTFVNDKGAQFSCTVEYAPYQKVPRKIRRRDPKENTLDKDPEYLDFLEKLDKEPPLLATAEAANRQGNQLSAETKRVTPLMQFLQDKWSGKLAAPQGKSRQNRQKAERAISENLPPPPGFEPLPKAGGKAPRAKPSGDGRAHLEAAHEAVSAALEGVGSKSRGPSGREKMQRKKPGSKKPGSDRQAAEEKEAAEKPAIAGPKKILQKPATREPAPLEGEEGASQKGKTVASQQEEPSAPKPRSAPKPVRVRAGYQMYTPKTRAEPRAAPTAPASDVKNGTATPPQRSSREPSSLFSKEKSFERRRSSNSGAQEQGGDWEARNRPRADSLAAARPEKPPRRKPHAPEAQRSFPATEGSARGLQPADASGGDTWDVPSQGPEWIIPIEEPAAAASAAPPLDAESELPRGKGKASRGGRRHWRAKTEPSG